MIESSLSASALSTDHDKAGKMKGASIEFKSICLIAEFQMQALAGGDTGGCGPV